MSVRGITLPLSDAGDDPVDGLSMAELLERREREARNREVDEILNGRTRVCHYYTGVADGIALARELLEGREQ